MTFKYNFRALFLHNTAYFATSFFGKSALCSLQSLMLNFTLGALCCLLDHQQKYVGTHLGKSVETLSLQGLMNCM